MSTILKKLVRQKVIDSDDEEEKKELSNQSK